jgi:Mor family transcriptional regulator
MKCTEDILKFIIAAFRTMGGEDTFSEAQALQVENQVRREYGGEAVYISKLDRDARRETILREFNGRNRKELCAKHGLSRTQFYEILKGE